MATPGIGRELAVVGRRLCEPLTGVGRYLDRLLYYWARSDTPFEKITVYSPGEPNLTSAARVPPVEVRVIPARISPLFWENAQLPPRLRSADLIFAPYTLPLALARRGVVSNLGIYEARPQDFSLPARLRTTPFFRASARRARLVIANSESTRNDVIRYYGPDGRKVRVIYLGIDEELSPGGEDRRLPEAVRAQYRLPGEPFFLFVGKLSKRRNIPALVEAFAAARAAASLPQSLIVVGPDYLGIDVPALAAKAGVADHVRHIPYVPMDRLIHFYRAATAYILPSVHEGFSLTVPEAMACGAPAIVFDHAALEGGVREAAWVLSEPSAGALAEAMRRVATEPELAARLRQASLDCARGFHWEKTARETMDALASCLRR